jgi:hypothetical protein
VKYVVLIYQNPSTWEKLSEQERDDLMREFDAHTKELEESGELVGGAALADPAQAKTVKVKDGETTATDGPFAESKEHLAGYFIVDVETEERAIEIAAFDPNARLGGVEVRAIMDEAGGDL